MVCTQRHRQAHRIVRDAIDALDDCPHDRVMRKPNGRPIYQCGEQNSGHVELTAVAHRGGVSGTTMLVIAGIRTRLINRGLAYAAAQSAPNGITLNASDGFAYLPRYSEAPENQRLSLSAAALRWSCGAASELLALTSRSAWGIRISPERGAGAAKAAPALPRGCRFAAARREERHEPEPNKEKINEEISETSSDRRH
jgi:hypothetical protein